MWREEKRDLKEKNIGSEKNNIDGDKRGGRKGSEGEERGRKEIIKCWERRGDLWNGIRVKDLVGEDLGALVMGAEHQTEWKNMKMQNENQEY